MKKNDNEKAIDGVRQFGTMVFLSAYNWTDYETKEVKGVNIVISSSEFGGREKVIRIKGLTEEMFKDYQIAEKISFTNIVANDWEFNGKRGTTYSADSISKVK